MGCICGGIWCQTILTSGVYIIAPISINPHPTFCIHLYFEDFVLEIDSEDVKWYAVGRFGGQRASSVRLASHPCFHNRQRDAGDEGTFKGENYFITRKALFKYVPAICYLLRRESYLRDVFWFLHCVQGKGSDEEGGKFTTIWRGRWLYWPIFRFHLSRVCSRRHGPRHGDEQVFDAHQLVCKSLHRKRRRRDTDSVRCMAQSPEEELEEVLDFL